ncbi:outer membrane transport energization protein TonB [Citreimonas salinaria]|uniref:Outer membrane transport energization protein TonB n=1 Tax=Citreimonas salinaria TaxID=321339 RepID=A0A1H3LIN6_9RHOB|nr:outer membrane transport energization protein TonB [Citreimonas salinaria]
MASSKAAKLAALVVAGAVHAGIAWALYGAEEPEIYGAQGGQAARTGSFADLVQGTIAAESAAEVADPVAPQAVEAEHSPDDTPQRRPDAVERPEAEPVPQTVPAPTEPSMSARPAAVVQPERTAAPARSAPAPEPTPETTPRRDALAALLPQRADGLVAVVAEPAAPEEPEAVQAPAPETDRPEMVQPVAPELLAPVVPEDAEPAEVAEAAPETIEAADPDSAAPPRSLRPARRSAEFEERQQAAPQSRRQQTAQPQRQPAPEREAQRGNADQNVRSGAATGRSEAQARQQGTRKGTAQQAGNAAASNYPGQVMAQINRVGRPRMNHRGRSRVSFTISSAGGLAGLSIARSSGTSALDRAALKIIQRAAPFPPPPPGATRSYAIWIEFR